MIWIALFSQTGSEIVAISELIGRKPDATLTNNDNLEQYNEKLVDQCYPMIVGKHNDLMDYLRVQDTFEVKKVLITLHGYLRIIPEDICNQYTIYNGHPAPVHLYPELKGKDKQESLYLSRDKYPFIGSVIHRVTPGVDDGPLAVTTTTYNRLTSVEEAYSRLKIESFKSWDLFFNHYVPNLALSN